MLSNINRPARARTNAAMAQAMLAECRFCAHDCAVNRLAGPGGRCHAGAETRYFCSQVEVTDELDLIPTYAIAFSGCDLRCAFCITGAESWNARAGEFFDTSNVAAKAIAAALRRFAVPSALPAISASKSSRFFLSARRTGRAPPRKLAS